MTSAWPILLAEYRVKRRGFRTSRGGASIVLSMGGLALSGIRASARASRSRFAACCRAADFPGPALFATESQYDAAARSRSDSISDMTHQPLTF